MEREQKMLLAGELALGLLDGDERRAAEDLVHDDPVTRRELEFWQTQFAKFGDEIPAAEYGAPVHIRQSLASMVTDEPAELWLRGWWQDLLRMASDTPWVVMLLTVKAALLLYLILLFL